MVSKRIKFRIYDPITKIMRTSGSTPSMLQGFFRDTATLNTLHGISYEQFTGLLDKNGKGVCCGDLLKRKGDKRIYQVAMDVNGIRPWHTDFLLSSERGRTCAGDFSPLGQGYIAEKCEVIGNIHENPDMME